MKNTLQLFINLKSLVLIGFLFIAGIFSSSAQLLLEAKPDLFPPIYNVEGGNTASVILNDRLANNPVTTAIVALTPGVSPIVGMSMRVNGSISVVANLPVGVYLYPYKICEIANPTNCSNATACASENGTR